MEMTSTTFSSTASLPSPEINITRLPDAGNASAADDSFYKTSSFYCACIMIFLCLFGICGNLLSIYVFSRRSMRSSSINILLIGLSCSDFLLLVLVVPIFALPPLSLGTKSIFVQDFTQYLYVFVYPVAMILQSNSVWIFMIITVERFMAVCFPLRVGQYCTAGRAKLGLLVIFILATLYNFVRFWEFELIQCQKNQSLSCGTVLANVALKADPPYWLWFGTVMYLLTQFLVPFIVIAVLNSMVVYKMYQARKQRARLTISERTEHRTALMMIIVIVVFAVCYTLSFVINFYEAVVPDLFYHQSTADLAYLLSDVSNTLIVLNSACTCLIYLGFSRRYRYISKSLTYSCLPQKLLKRLVSAETLDRLDKNRSFLNFSIAPNGIRARNNSSTAMSSVLLQKQSSSIKRCASNLEESLKRSNQGYNPPERKLTTCGTSSSGMFLSPGVASRDQMTSLGIPKNDVERNRRHMMSLDLPKGDVERKRVPSRDPMTSPDTPKVDVERKRVPSRDPMTSPDTPKDDVERKRLLSPDVIIDIPTPCRRVSFKTVDREGVLVRTDCGKLLVAETMADDNGKISKISNV